VERVEEDVAVVADEAEVDAPGVDADAVDLRPSGTLRVGLGVAGRLAQPRLQLLPLPQQVPVQVAAHPAGGVGEAVLLLEPELPVLQRPEQRPPALGAEVEGEEVT
jgi:hypothetical protein